MRPGQPGGDSLLPMLTIREAADILRVHISTLRRWEKSGFVSSIRVGPRGHRRYSREMILDLAHSQGGANGSPGQ